MQLEPDIVFNLAFSATPAEPALAGALELLGRPFTGSGSLAIGLANDKILSRQLMRAAGIPVPDYVVLSPGRRTRSFEFVRPWIVKPASLANSDGIRASSIVTSREQALRQAERNWRRFGVPSLCETFVVGREFQVGLIEMHRSFGITAVAELGFEGAAPGYGFKSEPFMVRGERHRLFEVSQHIARLPVPAITELSSIARRAAEVLKLRGYAKIDIRMDGRGRFFVLEANANPGLWPGIAIWRRPSFRLNVQRIMAAALHRAGEGARC
jgi:D-alanine-D-alanine ligase